MRGVIQYLFTEGVKRVGVICQMQVQYGDNCLSPSKIC
jgi:hypothetical protein